MRRRRFLQAAVGAVTLGSVSSGVQAAEDYRGAKPDHVSLRYSQSEMDRFRPAVIDPPRPSPDEQAQQWYGWAASSPEYDLDAYVYVMKYRVQRGTTAWDSHRRDREPVYVFTDPELDEIREVVYSGYHWLSVQEDAPPTDEIEGEDRATFRIIQPHNHYVLSEADPGEYDVLEVSPLGTADGEAFHPDENRQTTFESWLDTGWRGNLAAGVVQEPWRMRSRDSWWADGRETLFTRTWANLQLTLAGAGIERNAIVGTADETDLTE